MCSGFVNTFVNTFLTGMKIKAVLLGRARNDGEQQVYVRIYKNGKNRYIHTGIFINPANFDKKTGLIVKHKNPEELLRVNSEIMDIVSKYSRAASALGTNAQTMNHNTVKEMIIINSGTREAYSTGNVYDVGVQYVNLLAQEGRSRYGETITSTLSKLRDFYGEEKELSFNTITVEFLKSFRRWYVPTHGKPVTFNKHLRNIKLLFNEARRNKVIPRDIYPFDDLKIPGTYAADIRCVSAETIYKISTHEGLGRDFFMLTFYLFGMNLIDIMSIPYTEEDYVTVTRIKTSRSTSPVKLTLKIQPEAKEIISRYPDPDKRFLVRVTRFSDYRNLNAEVNDQLKEMAKKMKISETLTLTYARHSVATIAGSLKIPDNVIDKGLMHSASGMIEKYRQFDYKIVDNALRKVINEVMRYGNNKTSRRR